MKPDGHTIIARVPKALHDWLVAEQARLFVEEAIEIPVSGVVRRILQQAKRDQEQAAPPPPTAKKKAAR